MTVNGDVSVGIENNDKPLGEGNKLHFRGLNENGHHISVYRYNEGVNETELRVHIGNSYVRSDKFTVGNIIGGDTRQQWRSWLTVQNNGFVGINNHMPKYNLDVTGSIHATTVEIEKTLEVKGAIRTTSIKVESVDNFADFVFDRSYPLRPLSEVERFVKENGHLPEIPSAGEVKEKGMDLVEMQVKLLQKVEELTLYVIQQQKTIDELKERLGE